jgi:hypothetical protein
MLCATYSSTRKFYLFLLLKVSQSRNCSQNWKMVWHFYGKTKTAIIWWKNQFRPQFWAQIVAGVGTHPYSPFLSTGDHFGRSYEENQVQKISVGIYHTILYIKKSEIDFCTRIFHFAERIVGFRLWYYWLGRQNRQARRFSSYKKFWCSLDH